MRLLPKIILCLSSLVFFSFVSCKISRYKQSAVKNSVLNRSDIIPVVNNTNATKFQTTIDVLKNHLTGILIVKQTDSASTRLVFITELGMKMFDLEMKNGEMNVMYVFEPLNKPQVVNALKKNFKDMLLLDIYGKTGIAFTDKNNNTLFRLIKAEEKQYFTTTVQHNLSLQETFQKRKRTSKILYTYNNELKTYSLIKCKQYGFVKFYFELTQIPKTND